MDTVLAPYTLRRELLDRILILGEAHLRAVLIEYQVHYNAGRPHQGIAQRLPGCDRDPPSATAVNLDGQRIHREPTGGLINEYSRAADATTKLQASSRILFRADRASAEATRWLAIDIRNASAPSITST